ncbi:MAG TPA: 16S rRNA (guanine(527)-N(7))-methyltransferase RsmG [Candidatus Sumerlaeota bacterium]|nr:16S rRNA (guanine(527)-N(7))-methyltransferase RsmG [Candidatus Sumerlaeota bacterium]HPS00230.1 16S rRNA (guanine(527)-N(7))-methyltransferase RsmG [Candidatus Sumerlaeota bacterium]
MNPTPLPPRLQALDTRQQDQLAMFAQLLLDENRTTNLTAIRDLDGIYFRHFEDSLVGLDILKDMKINKSLSGNTFRIPRLLDVGSGAGLPGLVLAIALPDWEIVSLEATGKKARFQRLVAKTLDLKNVFVVEGRAEEMAHHPEYREQFDGVTARAVAALPLLAELCVPFLRPGGHFLAWKGPRLEEELATTQGACLTLGGEISQQVPYQIPLPVEENTPETPETGIFPGQIVVIHKTAPTPDRFPRPTNAMRKRPLGS